MIKFDKKGFYIPGKIKKVIKQEPGYLEEIRRDNPSKKFKYDKSRYRIIGHANRKHVGNNPLEVVPLYTTTYKGSKHEKYNYKGSGAMAVVGQSIKSNKKLIVYFLIPYK